MTAPTVPAAPAQGAPSAPAPAQSSTVAAIDATRQRPPGGQALVPVGGTSDSAEVLPEGFSLTLDGLDERGEGPVRAAPTPVQPAGRPIPALVAQPHGGAIYAGGVPGNRGGAVMRERRHRAEAIREALMGHVERLTAIVDKLLNHAEGEQWRCTRCGAMGPKIPKVALTEAATVLRQLAGMVIQPADRPIGSPSR